MALRRDSMGTAIIWAPVILRNLRIFYILATRWKIGLPIVFIEFGIPTQPSLEEGGLCRWVWRVASVIEGTRWILKLGVRQSDASGFWGGCFAVPESFEGSLARTVLCWMLEG